MRKTYEKKNMRNKYEKQIWEKNMRKKYDKKAEKKIYNVTKVTIEKWHNA